MSVLDRVEAADGDGASPGLVVLSGAIAAASVFPLLWLFAEALSIDAGTAWDLLTTDRALGVLLDSVGLMAGVTVASIALGVPLAYLTVRTDLPFRRLWTVLVALPLVVPSYVGAVAFVSAFGPRGEFQSVLAPLGVESVPEIYGLRGAILVITLYTYPYVYLTTRAALLSFDARLIDAARTLNRGRLAAFRSVTLPQIAPAIVAGALLAALYAVSDFGTPVIMQAHVFTQQIDTALTTGSQLETAALLSLELLAVAGFVLVLERAVGSGSASGSGDVGGGQRIRLGRWRWPATLLPASVVALALVVPLWILGQWVVRTPPDPSSPYGVGVQHVVNSVTIAGATAVIAALAALPVAYYAARHESRLSELFERATYLGFAVPGVVLGLALVFFGTTYAPWLYQTLPLLAFAYVVRFLPQAVGSVRTSTLQVDRRLVEAARTLGDSPLLAFRRVTLPLIWPGVVAGGALVFLTTMKELPLTIYLRPSTFETIVTAIWSAQRAQRYQYAALPALLLLVVSGLTMLVTLASDSQGRGY